MKNLKAKIGAPLAVILIVLITILAKPYFSDGSNINTSDYSVNASTVLSSDEFSNPENYSAVTTTLTCEYEGDTYRFRNMKRLNEHFAKHGEEVGASTASEYEAMASAVITNPNALYTTEKEDGDHVFYIKDTGEFVIVSPKGYIRTYYIADYDYFLRQ